ncbi:phosphatase PAP2 family protein [Niallia sp. FSL W8-0635]|uniref:phosphatase PAP2 family protein n=1 Tax=Niallia sp. FSL W8-0635 TaxID=2975337 RepID=UPI0009CA0CC0|nr:membrane-associated phospholipid phosphatase [Mycobacteroides abscessus subsp. abscessus]HEO8422373.1 phosphatase PAP2 family protein [Yersinia enterocolitica]HEO8422840.1 phosphatase PAP2 family protein [Yersinia enterocolitica]
MERKITLKYIMMMIAIILVFSSIFYVIAKLVSSSDILSFDNTIIDFIQSYISEDLTIWVERVTFLGSVSFITTAILIITILLLWRKKYALAIFFITANGLGALLNKLLKWFFKRERPDILPVIIEKGYSFPSGHSMGSLIFFGSCAYLCIHIVKSTGSKIIAYIIACLFIVLIGVSRIYLGVHYPTDVVGGYSIGIAYSAICILAFRLYEFRTKR